MKTALDREGSRLLGSREGRRCGLVDVDRRVWTRGRGLVDTDREGG